MGQAANMRHILAKRHLLIDGDVLVYRFAHGEQQVSAWDVDGVTLYTVHSWLDPARKHLGDYIRSLLEELDASSYTVALSDLNANFRTDVMPTYKEGRKSVQRPLLFLPLRSYLIDQHAAVVWRNLEADDVLGILGTRPTERNVVTVSIDKDMRTVPGSHFNFNKPEEGIEVVGLLEAERNWLKQTLSGDSTDGYPGCPKIGPVRAARIIDAAVPAEQGKMDLDDLLAIGWEAVVTAYRKAKLGPKAALMNGRCARILRHGDYNHETGEVSLWTPPRSGQ